MANNDKARESRFRIIEMLLLWEGEVTNERIREVLGIQVVQASRVLSEYALHNPEQVESENGRSPYRASTNIEPKYSQGSVDEYISLSHRFDGADGVIFDVRYDLTSAMPNVISQIALAIKNHQGLNIHYESMTNPSGKQRLVYPHAIVRAGRRWHIRAWCTERLDFRDFVLGRIRKVSLHNSQALHQGKHDIAWNKKVAVIIGAHPKLTEEQIRVIRHEFFKGAVSRRLVIRSCLVQYVLQDMRVAIHLERELPPEYQITLLNRDEIKEYLFNQEGKI